MNRLGAARDGLGMKRFALPALVLGFSAAAVLSASSANALSCVEYIEETLELHLASVTSEGEEVEALAGVDTLDQILTSGGNGEGLLFWAGDADASEDHGKFYTLDMEIEPTEEVAEYIEEQSARRTGGSVCSGIPFRPVLPGVYLFSDNYLDPTGEPKHIDDPVVTIPADRETVVLEFNVDDTAYTATYEVEDFYFDYDESGCGCSATPRAGSGAWALGLAGLLLFRRGRRRRANQGQVKATSVPS